MLRFRQDKYLNTLFLLNQIISRISAKTKELFLGFRQIIPIYFSDFDKLFRFISRISAILYIFATEFQAEQQL